MYTQVTAYALFIEILKNVKEKGYSIDDTIAALEKLKEEAAKESESRG